MDTVRIQIEEELGMKISDQQFSESVERAQLKLNSIIKRFGDGNGQRMESHYLSELIYEDIVSVILMGKILLNMEKEHSAKSQSTLQSQPYCSM